MSAHTQAHTNRRSRFFALALALGCTAALLAACGDDGAEQDDDLNVNSGFVDNSRTSNNTTGANNGTNNGSTSTNNGTSTSTNNGTSTSTNNATTTPPTDAGTNNGTTTPDTGTNNGTTTPPDDTGDDVAPDTPPEDVGPDSDDVAPDVPDTFEPVERSCLTEVVYEGGAGAGSVNIAGAFNGWDPDVTPMVRDGGVWRAELALSPGSYPYKFVTDGQYEGNPPESVYTQWDGDFENRSLRVADCNVPEWRVVAPPTFSPDGVLTATFQLARAFEGPALDPDSVVLTIAGQPATPSRVDAESGVVEVRFEAPEWGKYSIRLDGADADGTPAENNTLYLPIWYEAERFSWQDGVIYLIFTDRFRDTDGVDHRIDGVEERANYLGGDFRGITQAIEEGYFQQMGVNTLWLSPVYDNTEQGYRDKRDETKLMSGFHGYWPISLDPEPRYGDTEGTAEERLLELSRVAHENGIRIMFDLALNHVHQDHPYCQENPQWCDQTCQCGAPGCGWDPSERGLDCQFDYFLPDLSYRNHAIVERVIADTLDMIEKYDVDGLRIDAARHMDHVIMRTLRMTVRDRIEENGGAPYYLVGETFTDDRGQIMDYVSDYELHGQFDFAMRSAIRGALASPFGSFRGLDDAAAASESPGGYGDFVWWMSPFFGNHDIDRIATVIAGNDQGPWGDTVDLMAAGPADTVDQWDIINRMTLAYAYLLTYKGIPLLYYGDEIGLAGSQDPDNRRMMMWDHNANQRALLERVRQIGQARSAIPALRHGERREIWRDDDLYVYVRHTSATDCAIVAMNKGAARTETVTVPAEFGIDGQTLTSFNSDRTLSISANSASVTLDPWEYAIFQCPTE